MASDRATAKAASAGTRSSRTSRTSLGRPQSLLAESGRVEAFSDGVLAIVITLLVLDLHAPETRGSMLHELAKQWPAYISYLASFAYVGVIWLNHHALFTRIAAVDSGLLWRNLMLLLTTSVLPFPTAVLSNALQHGTNHDRVAAVALYALISAAMAGSWLLLFHHLGKNEHLLVSHTPGAFFIAERKRALFGVAAYVFAGALGVWQSLVSLVVFAVLPIFYAATNEGLPGSHKQTTVTADGGHPE